MPASIRCTCPQVDNCAECRCQCDNCRQCGPCIAARTINLGVPQTPYKEPRNTMSVRLTKTLRKFARRTCTKCGLTGHNVATCTGHEHYYDKLGVEVEGMWKNLHEAQENARAQTGDVGAADGSLPGGTTVYENGRNVPLESWEIRTRPGTLGETLRQTLACYPDAVNEQCGLHMHMSFTDELCYSLLASEDFFVNFRAAMSAFGTRRGINSASQFWSRLRGENRYCQINAITDWSQGGRRNEATILGQGDRYRQVNFMAFDRHKTVEFRLLPMFQDPAITRDALTEIVKIVEAYLHTAMGAIETPIVSTATATLAIPIVTSAEIDLDFPSVSESKVIAIDLPDPVTHGPLLPGVLRTNLAHLHYYHADTEIESTAQSLVRAANGA